MSGNHSEKEKEHKERIRKLKAKTSKMRLAVASKKTPLVTLGDKKFYNITEFEDHMASTDRPTYSGEIPGAADKLRKQRAKPKKTRQAAVAGEDIFKKNKIKRDVADDTAGNSYEQNLTDMLNRMNPGKEKSISKGLRNIKKNKGSFEIKDN